VIGVVSQLIHYRDWFVSFGAMIKLSLRRTLVLQQYYLPVLNQEMA